MERKCRRGRVRLACREVLGNDELRGLTVTELAAGGLAHKLKPPMPEDTHAQRCGKGDPAAKRRFLRIGRRLFRDRLTRISPPGNLGLHFLSQVAHRESRTAIDPGPPLVVERILCKDAPELDDL